MKKALFFGVIGIIILFAIVIFTVKSFSAPLSTAGKIIDNGGEEQQVTLSYKNYNYYPQIIEVKKGASVKITADDSVKGCFTAFMIPGLGIQHSFTKSRTLEFTPDKIGTFSFSCGMGMATGKIVVRES